MNDDTRTCDEWRALIADALAGELSESEARQLEKHLDTCEECAAEMRSLRSVWAGLGELPETRDRLDARAALLEKARAERQRGRAPGVVGTSSDRGARYARSLRWLSRAAVIVLVFAGGLVVGRIRAPSDDTETQPAPSDEPRYLLVLHEDDSFSGPPVNEAVAEYAAWAEDLAVDGRLAAAEKLTEDAGLWLTGPEGDRLQAPGRGAAGDAEASPEAIAGRATGFFIVSARSDSAAARIAATMPHLKYGGTVQVRQIEEIGD